MKKILIHSIYPAPYRVEIFQKIKKLYDCDIFLSTSGGDDRSAEWFLKGDYHVIDSEEGKKFFSERKKKIGEYDLVLIYEYSDKKAIDLILRCIRKKVPYILNCDGVMLFEHGNRFKNLIKKYLIKNAAAYFASGEHAKQYLLKFGAKEDKIFYHNFTALKKKDILSKLVLDEEKLELRKKLGLSAEKRICIAVGRFIPLKRYDILIKNWATMPADVCLLLIGGGPEKEKYESIIGSLGLKNVIIDDFHPFDELLYYYKAADLFVHPTSYDVWGLVINEAMACGLPVIVTDTCVAGLELIKNGENGYMTRLGDDREFTERLKEVISDNEKRKEMSQNALNTIQPYYVENMIDSQLKTIEKVLKENAR